MSRITFGEAPHPKGLPTGKSASAEWGINEQKSTLN